MSTPRALFDSPRYGASIWLVSPVKITFVPSPTRVRIVRSVVGSRFWASSIDDELALQRTAAQERDRLQRQLAAVGQLVDQVAGVVTAAAGR